MGFQTPVIKKRISTKNVEKVKKRVSTNKVKTATTKKRTNTKVKKVKTPVNKKKLNARELLIVLERRPEIVAMGKALYVMSTDFTQGQFADYLKFLVVKGIEKDFNTTKMSPPRAMVESFWHSHILDTAAYHSTCVHLFGQYVHHKQAPVVKLCVPGFVSNAALIQMIDFGHDQATVVKMKTYWDAHHKHFPKDALQRLFSTRPSDEDDGNVDPPTAAGSTHVSTQTYPARHVGTQISRPQMVIPMPAL